MTTTDSATTSSVSRDLASAGSSLRDMEPSSHPRHERSPSRLERSWTRPLRQVSRTFPMLVAQRPMAWMVAATKSLSMLRM